jgi:ATP/maltotriose-dependent transcriptional regulator MalT
MSLSTPPLPPNWQYYKDCARQTHNGRVDDFGYGREEHLWETLSVIESGADFTDDRRLRLDRIPRNRAKKHHRLRIRLINHGSIDVVSKIAPVELADEVNRVRKALTAGEWEVACRLAAGQSYKEVARDLGVTPSALKVRTSRWRRRVREKLAGHNQAGVFAVPGNVWQQQ